MATKNDLIKALSSSNNYLSKKDANDVIELILGYIEGELAKENRIEIRGFGSFSIRQRKMANSDKLYKTIYYRMTKNKFVEK